MIINSNILKLLQTKLFIFTYQLSFNQIILIFSELKCFNYNRARFKICDLHK